MWNVAYQLAGPACTIQQFEALTGIRLDHFVVVDFTGFQDMVDAVGGVEVCIPEDIDDRAHGMYLEAGTRKLEGIQALAPQHRLVLARLITVTGPWHLPHAVIKYADGHDARASVRAPAGVTTKPPTMPSPAGRTVRSRARRGGSE